MTIEPERTSSASPSGNVDFLCGNCGAGMTWDPSADAPAREYCGNKIQVPRKEDLILERDLQEAGHYSMSRRPTP